MSDEMEHLKKRMTRVEEFLRKLEPILQTMPSLERSVTTLDTLVKNVSDSVHLLNNTLAGTLKNPGIVHEHHRNVEDIISLKLRVADIENQRNYALGGARVITTIIAILAGGLTALAVAWLSK